MVTIPLVGINVNKKFRNNLIGLMKATLEKKIRAIDVIIVHEPFNPHDPKALKVALNTLFVGYIPKDHQHYFTNPWNSVTLYDWGMINEENAYCYIALK